MEARRFLVALAIVVLAVVGVGLAIVNLRGTARTSIAPIEIDSTSDKRPPDESGKPDDRRAGKRPRSVDAGSSPSTVRTGAEPAPVPRPVPAGGQDEDEGEGDDLDDSGGDEDRDD